jgi:hypothetical protein
VIAVTPRWIRALDVSGNWTCRATHRDPFTGVLTIVPINGGSITVDVTGGVRRKLNMTSPPDQAMFNRLIVPGGEITVTHTRRFIDRSVETITLGVFRPDETNIRYSPGGEITLTCPDRWLLVQRNDFEARNWSVAANTGWREIQRLIEGAWPTYSPFPGWAHLDTSATTKVGAVSWDSRETAVLDIARANALDVYFDNEGRPVLQQLPVLTDSSVAVATVVGVKGGEGSITRQRSYAQFYNTVVVRSSASDTTLAPVVVRNDTDPLVDKFSASGPLGRVPKPYSSPYFRNATQMRAAGIAFLRKGLSVSDQVTAEQAPNHALDGWDVLSVIAPKQWNQPRFATQQLIESVNLPLTARDGAQTITLRSTTAAEV